MKSKLRKLAISLGIVFLALIMSITIMRMAPLFEMAENWMADFRIGALSPLEPQHPDIVIIAITEETLQGFTYREPVDRAFLANLLKSVEDKGARAVLLDILLDQPTESAKDVALKIQLQEMEIPVVVSYANDSGGNFLTEVQEAYLDDFLPAELRGMANFAKDRLDGTVRWIFPGQKMPDGTFVEGLSAKLAAKLGVDDTPSGFVRIAWRGAPDKNTLPFRAYPAHMAHQLSEASLRNKIVLIGADLSINDRHRTPFSFVSQKEPKGTPGVIVHAHALAQLLEGRSFPPLGPLSQVVVVFAAALFGLVLAWVEINIYLSVVIELLVLIGYWASAPWLFHNQGVLIPLIAPTISSVLGFWMTQVYSGSKTRKEKRMAQREAEVKKELLANMSHELRTPLNAVIGRGELLQENMSDSTNLKHTGIILASAKSLLRLINDILDYSKIESGRMSMEQIVFDLRQSLEETMETLANTAESKGLTLDLKVDENLSAVFLGDPMRLRQVVVNLVGNAIKFTEKGSVTVRVVPESEEGMLRFAVTDTGIGIPADRLGAIFEKYAQAEGSTARKHGGTGLGTTISKQIVEQMKGRIWVESEVGKGSTFFFVVHIPEVPEGVECQAEDRVASPIVAASVSRVFRILVVDDIKENRDLAEIRLKQHGHHVSTAEDGLEAVDAFGRLDLDVILMDINMPRMGGIDATREVRNQEAKQESKSHVSIIALTAGDAADDKDSCLEAGMDDFATKPIDFNRLLALMERIVPDGVGEVVDEVVAENSEPSKPVSQLEVPPPFDNLEGFDVAKGLENWGDSETYKKTLVGFGRQHAGDMDLIRAAFGKDDIQAVKDVAHALKGVAGTLAATDLAAAAKALDAALRGKEGELTVADLKAALERKNVRLDDLVRAVEDTLQVVVASCRWFEPEEESTSVEAPVVRQIEPIHVELMQNLVQYLDQGDFAKIEPCLKDLGVSGIFPEKEFRELAGLVDDLDFFGAAESLRKLADSLGIVLNGGEQCSDEQTG